MLRWDGVWGVGFFFSFFTKRHIHTHLFTDSQLQFFLFKGKKEKKCVYMFRIAPDLLLHGKSSFTAKQSSPDY